MIELLSNIDIEDICRQLNINLITCTSKNLLSGKIVNGGYVINLQNANAGPGSHWTTFYIRGNDVMYFDSFGQSYPYDVFKFVNKNKKMNLNFNKTQIQDIPSTACGYFCIAFLHHMENHKGKSLVSLCDDFTNKFDPVDQKQNDAILQSIFKDIFE